MNRRQKIIVSVVGIFIVLLALVGLTYGYFLTRIQGNTNTKSITVTTADLKLVYADGSANIEALKIVPGDTIGTKKFTVANEGNATVENYKVYLENVQNSFEIKSDVAYTLTCKSYEKYGETDQTISGTCAGVEDATTFPSVMTVIATNTIAVGITHEYELTVTYENQPYDQSVDMNKSLIAKINIYDGKTKFLETEILSNALSEESVTYNKTEYIEPSEQDGNNYTIPAHSINNADERIISYTLDDYGTSYYYRGNVEDNYLNFAGMCWRIVRIEGDGSTKLILEDRYAECDDDIDSDGDATADYKYTGNWSDNTNYEFGYNSDYRAEFINYSGGLADSFKNFQTNNLINFYDKLKIDEWCYDNQVTETSGSEEYYGAYTRIIVNKKPSLKCTGTILTKFNDDSYMYAGTLTADEVVFAGADSNNASIFTYYLNSKFLSSYDVLSLHSNDGYGDTSFSVISTGLSYGTVDYSPSNSRPAVTLKPSSIITDGDGTIGNPYIIE